MDIPGPEEKKSENEGTITSLSKNSDDKKEKSNQLSPSRGSKKNFVMPRACSTQVKANRVQTVPDGWTSCLPQVAAQAGPHVKGTVAALHPLRVHGA